MDKPNAEILSLRQPASPAGLVLPARTLTLIASDIASFILASVLAHAIAAAYGPSLQWAPDAASSAWPGWATLLMFAGLAGWFWLRGRFTARVPFWADVSHVAAAVAVAFLVDCFIRSSIYGAPPGLEDFARWLLVLPCLLLLRQLARVSLQARGLWGVKTLIVGDDAAMRVAEAALSSDPALGYDVVGALNLQRAALHRIGSGGIEALHAFGADFAIVATGGSDAAAENRMAAALARAQVPFALVPTMDNVPVIGFSKHYLFAHDVMLLTSGNNLARPLCRLIKAIFDQVVAATALLFLSPLFLVLCAMVSLDGGPAFYGHWRIGEGGARFRCLKFRTMCVDADAVLTSLLERDPVALQEWQATHKLSADPRITRIGAVLRKTSLDELPQLLNVLRGEMSLVGPRPIVDAELARYGDKIAFYFEAKPGITGLWQVSGRSTTTYEHRVKLDVWYVRNWSLWHDIAILLKTVPAVLLREGAV